MLNNLKAELARKGLIPHKAIMQSLGCTEKTARTKLNGTVDFTVPEAVKIINDYFQDDNFEILYLFAKFNKVN